jgi:hypothetical protein
MMGPCVCVQGNLEREERVEGGPQAPKWNLYIYNLYEWRGVERGQARGGPKTRGT